MASKSGRFPPECRLRTPADFKTVFDSCHRISDSVFVVLARPNGMGLARLGFAISAKRLHSAVRRNTVKRVVRESFRRWQDRLCGLDLVVMTQRHVDARNRELLRGSIQRHWEKLAQRCGSSS